MKTGTVLYLTDVVNLPSDLDPTLAAETAGLDPRWAEVAASARGWPTLQDATLRLAERGAHRVVARTARVTGDGTLALSGLETRLHG